MTAIIITIKLDSDAFFRDEYFLPVPELTRILTDVAHAISARGLENEPIFDINGNRVGNVALACGECDECNAGLTCRDFPEKDES